MSCNQCFTLCELFDLNVFLQNGKMRVEDGGEKFNNYLRDDNEGNEEEAVSF